MQTETQIDWKEEHAKQKEYSASLEKERSNLWTVNSDLRDKIGALERGQEQLETQRDTVWLELLRIRHLVGAKSEATTFEEAKRVVTSLKQIAACACHDCQELRAQIPVPLTTRAPESDINAGHM